MNPRYFGLNQKIGQLIKNPADQGRIVAIAVAMAASANARLPSSPVISIPAFYGEQVFPVINETISEINESIIFAAKSAQDAAQKFWKMRYYAAFPAHMAHLTTSISDRSLDSRIVEKMDLLMVWCGGSFELAPELLDFMNKYRYEIGTLALDFTRFLAPMPAATSEEGRG